MEKPLAIANYFIQKSIETGGVMTPMKLIKLVYISHGWYLALTGKPLLEETVQAWQYGPVVPSIYHEFKNYGKSPITTLSFDFTTLKYPLPSDPEIIKFLDKIWAVYGIYDGLQLSALTHQANTPWDITWNQIGGKDRKEVPIGNELIRTYYIHKVSSQTSHAGN